MLTFSDIPLSKFQPFTLCWRKLTSLEYHTRNILVIPWTLRHQASPKRRSLNVIPHGIIYQKTGTSDCVCLLWFVLNQKFLEVHDSFNGTKWPVQMMRTKTPCVPLHCPTCCTLCYFSRDHQLQRKEAQGVSDKGPIPTPRFNTLTLLRGRKKLPILRGSYLPTKKIWVELWGKKPPVGLADGREIPP